MLHGVTRFISQSESALFSALDFTNGLAQLAFRRGPVFHNIVFVPLGVIQAGDVIACFGRMLPIGLFPDGNFLGSILAHRDFGKIRRIGHDDFQSILITILTDTQVLSRSLGQLILVLEATSQIQQGPQIPMDRFPVVASEIQSPFRYFFIQALGNILHISDISTIIVDVIHIGNRSSLFVHLDFRSPAGHMAHLGIHRIPRLIYSFKGHAGLVHLPFFHIILYGPIVGFVHLRLGSDVLDGDGLVRVIGIVLVLRIPYRQGQFSIGGGIAAVIRIGILD